MALSATPCSLPISLIRHDAGTRWTILRDFPGASNDPYQGTHRHGQIPDSLQRVDISRAVDYACEDAEVAFRVASILMPRIEAEGLGDLYRESRIAPDSRCWRTWSWLESVSTCPYLEKLSAEFGAMLDVLGS